MAVVCWALFTLHAINALFSMMAICGLEKRLCISHVLLALVVYDGVVLIWSQCVYFKSQKYNCNLEMTDLYFWLMGEILFFYLLTAFVICYFFRRFCQDPALIKEQQELEAAEEQAANEGYRNVAVAAPAGKKEKTTDPGTTIQTTAGGDEP